MSAPTLGRKRDRGAERIRTAASIRSAARLFAGSPGRRRSVAPLAVSAALLAAIAFALVNVRADAAHSPVAHVPATATGETTPVDYYDGPPISNAQIEREHDRAQACRVFLGYQPWPSSRSWEWATGPDYRVWVYDLWRLRAQACADVRAHFERLERSVPDAARWAATSWGVAASWLISCARSEGGLDAGHVAIGTHGDTGWWQFLSGTWTWMSNEAWKAKKPSPPPRYRRITSPVGQAYTAAWAFSRGLSFHWYGTGC